MPEVRQPKFEHSVLERDIIRLSQEVKEHRETLKKPELGGQEAVKAVLGARIQSQPTPPAAQNVSPVLPAYLQQEPAEIQLQVEKLVDLALHKGIDASIAEARKAGPFILDALHDSLTTKIYEELKARKLI